jgi:Tfp pilus assembly protein FimT
MLECALILGLIAVASAMGYPALVQWNERRALERAAAESLVVVQEARRRMAIHRSTVRLELTTDDTHEACLLLHTGRIGECSGCRAAQCRGTAMVVSRSAPWPADVAAQLQPSSLLWHGGSGTVVPTGILALRRGGQELQIVVNLLGRWRLCSPAPWTAQVSPC